jgi:5-methylcytosine-specific restriction endonuclease McrA
MPKKTIPKALREQVWFTQLGKVYEAKCVVSWCQNKITVFDFEVGHNLPESKGGSTTLDNLRPICARCNKSMSNRYSIDEWNSLGKPAAAGQVENVRFTCC